MFNSVALQVVIGLVFIYLLYSLFATVVSEIIATYIGLRARNLKEAVDRMLNDEKKEDTGLLSRIWDTFKLAKNPTNPRITNFYNHPEIKYLGSTGIFKTPSQFKAESFSKTILFLLNETGNKIIDGGNAKMHDPDEGDIKRIKVTPITKENIHKALEGIIEGHEASNSSEEEKIVLDHETAKYVLSLWQDSYGDIVKFKLHLEAWFDRTMEQCLEWYKRKIQIILLVLGFMLAWFFNADTFTIISKLSKDDKAREQIVSMANAYVENNRGKLTVAEVDRSRVNDSAVQNYNARLDSLLAVKKELEQDIANANSILGLGGWAPDTVMVTINEKTGKKIYTPQIDGESLSKAHQKITGGKIGFDTREKWCYFFRLLNHHFFGFLITAIAISLGAPFWFDLLNKLMKLRTSVKQDTDGAATGSGGAVSSLNREG